MISEKLRDDFSHNIKVVRCLTCGHVQLTPLPSQEENQLFYNNDSQTRNLMGETDLKLWQGKSEQDTKRRQTWLSNLISPQSKILDIGCGYVFFVDELTQHNYQAVGIDVSKERIDLAQTHLSGKFIQGWIDDDDDQFAQRYHHYFDVVTLFHVLEHISDPVTFINQCFNLVAPNGFLLIEVPNLADELLDYSVGM